MLTHIVLFKFKYETEENEINQVIEGLGRLPDKIEEIREFRLGRDILQTERSYDLGLVASFEDREALDRYQVHPEHQQVVSMVKAIASSVIAVDFLD